jgi:hypothetical protein
MTLLMQFSLALTSSHSRSHSEKKQACYEMSQYSHCIIIKLSCTVHAILLPKTHQMYILHQQCVWLSSYYQVKENTK